MENYYGQQQPVQQAPVAQEPRPVVIQDERSRMSFLPTLLLLGGILVLTIMGYIQSEKYIMQQAIDGCLQAGRVQFTEDGRNITTSEDSIFDTCMLKKGYK